MPVSASHLSFILLKKKSNFGNSQEHTFDILDCVLMWLGILNIDNHKIKAYMDSENIENIWCSAVLTIQPRFRFNFLCKNK